MRLADSFSRLLACDGCYGPACGKPATQRAMPGGIETVYAAVGFQDPVAAGGWGTDQPDGGAHGDLH